MWGCRSVCGAQCVAVVLVISRAGIGPKTGGSACKRKTEERKEYSACVLLFVYDKDKRSSEKLILSLGVTRFFLPHES